MKWRWNGIMYIRGSKQDTCPKYAGQHNPYAPGVPSLWPSYEVLFPCNVCIWAAMSPSGLVNNGHSRINKRVQMAWARFLEKQEQVLPQGGSHLTLSRQGPLKSFSTVVRTLSQVLFFQPFLIIQPGACLKESTKGGFFINGRGIGVTKGLWQDGIHSQRQKRTSGLELYLLNLTERWLTV